MFSLLTLCLLSTSAFAQVPEPPSAAPAGPEEATAVTEEAAEQAPKPFKLSGVYTVWGLTQNNFLFGAEHPLDDSAYTVQMLRLKFEAQKPTYGVVARLDAAQGWWGADNSPNTETVAGVDADGNPTTSTIYNPNAYFTDKDTNYAIHVDRAYGWANLDLGIPVQVRLGRMGYQIGQKLVLDMDFDGVQIEATATEDVHISLWWAKISEGLGAFTQPRGLLMSDEDVNADADLLALIGTFTPGEHQIDAFAIGYWDRSGDGTATYYPQGLGYLRSRWQPNLTQVLALGVSADLKFDVGEGLEIQGEADVLVGNDDVANTDHSAGMLDINNGNLFGWNGYLRAKQHVSEPLSLGLAFGIGSGDSDKTSGSGNINKIQTMGFFPLTNVWEDSVMPDIGGISPQGLGSPVSRGYRELENTTALQLFSTLEPVDRLKLMLSGTYLLATTPIQGFDATGAPTGDGASDLGFEVDLNGTYAITKGLSATALTGVFVPGAAAANLITGDASNRDIAWEIKLVAVAKF